MDFDGCFAHGRPCQRHSCRLSPWASQSACPQSCLASRDCASECSLQSKRVVVQVPFSVDLGQYRPVRPMLSTRRFQSPKCSRKHTTSRCENGVFVRHLGSTNPNTLDEHRVALVPPFSSLQSTMRRLGNPDKNDLRERHDFMSIMLTVGLFACRHPVALLPVSTDLPARMTQQPCPDRLVRAKRFTTAKTHLAIRTNRPSLFLNSLDSARSRIGC